MEAKTFERKLAAVVAADVVGYSRLMGADETGTLARLKALRETVVEPQVAAYGGRIVKLMGDGILAEFPSVVDAVACSVEMQRGTVARSKDLPKDQQIVVRIGINLGDILVEEDDIYGDGVNIAARLEPLAEPGGICISQAARDALGNKLPLDYDDMGPQQVKNIVESVRAYQVRVPTDAVMHPGSGGRAQVASAGTARATRSWRWASVVLVIVTLLGAGGAMVWWQPWKSPPAPEPTGQTALPLPDKPSVAVLPFVNYPEDPEQEYFSDGMTEDLITDLAKISGLFVVSRHAAFQYKGRSIKLQEISRVLGVQHLLEGSIRKVGDSMRINVQLVDTRTGGPIWAERYDRDLKDIFALQDDITGKIVAALAVKLTRDDETRLARRRTSNIEAYDLYLRARALHGGNTKETNLEARRLLKQAIDLDPTFAAAYAELSYVYNRGNQWSDENLSQEATLQASLKYARKAVQLDDQLPEAHARLAWALIWNKQYEEGIRAAKRAIEIDPNYADGYLMIGHIMIYGDGSSEEAIELSKKGMQLDPYSTYHYLAHIADGYWMLGQSQEALATLKRSVKLEPDFMPGHLWLAAVQAELGQLEEARASIAEVQRLSPQTSIEGQRKVLPYKDTAVLERLLSALRKAGLPSVKPSEKR